MNDHPTRQDWDTALRVLRAVLLDPAMADHQPEFKTLVAGVNRLGRKHARQQEALARLPQPDRRDLPAYYICKARSARPHASNSSLCPSCGDFNFGRRSGRTELHGRVAVLTGGRVKIGYETALKLLRDGARVSVTTRFPQDAARRYAQQLDAALW